MAWIATFPHNLALVRLAVSSKSRFTDGRQRRTRATTVGLLTQSNRARNRSRLFLLLEPLLIDYPSSYEDGGPYGVGGTLLPSR